MSLNDLVASQLDETGPTPVETENVMIHEDDSSVTSQKTDVTSEDRASATSLNADDNDQNIDSEQQKNDDLKRKMQHRIDKVTGSNRKLEDKVIRLEAEREAFEKYNQSNQEKTLQDHSIDTLTRFVADNQDDPELAAQVADARQVIIDKKIDERVNSFIDKQAATTNQEKGEQLTNQIINGISGDKLRDTSGEYYGTAMQCLHDLNQPEYANVNKDQMIAALMADREFLMKQQNGPTMNDRVKNNQNNNIKANIRQSSGGGSDLASYLENTGGRLGRSSVGEKGSANIAIRKLKMFEDLTGG